ncbi:MAG: helix-turn-helix transcriptional regulator [Caldilineaceae bacterium]
MIELLRYDSHKLVKRLGEKLHILRQRHHLTTRELGEQLGVSYVQISHIETGARKPSANLILKISLFFNVPVDQLMRDDVELG